MGHSFDAATNNPSNEEISLLLRGVARQAGASASTTYDSAPEGINKKALNPSLLATYYMGLVATMDQNIMLPTLWHMVHFHFGASPVVYGAILSMSSVSEILAAVIFGAWADRRPFKEPILMALFMCTLGNICYVFSYSWSVYGILISRTIAGACAGVTSVLIAYVTHSTFPEERNAKISSYWLVTLSSNIFGPLATLAATKIPVNDEVLNPLTMPAVFTGLFSALNLIYVFSYWPYSTSIHSSRKYQEFYINKHENLLGKFVTLARSVPMVGYLCLFMKLIFTMSVVVLQTVATPLAASTGLDESGASIMFVVVGVLILAGVLTAKLLTWWGKVTDHTLLLVAQILVFIGLFGCVEWFDPQGPRARLGTLFFLAATVFITFGNSIGITMVTSVYSKAIGANNPNKGALMGWLIMMAASARILGPIIAAVGYGYEAFTVVSASLIAAVFLGMVVLMVLKTRVIYLNTE